MSAAPALERLLRRDSALTLAALSALWALTWLYLLTGAGLGTAAKMGMSAVEMEAMAPARDPQLWLLTVAMWWAMMIAMMTPSAAPTILLYARVHRHHQAQGQIRAAAPPTALFLAGYFLVWLAFSIAATVLQDALQRSGYMSATTMSSQVRWLSGGVLVATGLYQLSPLKNACLSRCRAPAQFLSQHWRPGASGALRLGLLHGAWCVGCCWMLMALLLVGGVMNLAWIAALSLLVMAEKLLLAGPWVGRGAGIALLGWGAFVLLGR